MLCLWMYWHLSACTRFSYLRRGPEHPYPERPAAGPAGPCPCSLWSRHGRMSRSTACACWLRKEEGQERKRQLHHLSSCSNPNIAAVASELRLCEREDDGTKSGNSSVALVSCLCLWWMCWFFLSILQLAGQLMEVLGRKKNDFHLTSHGLFGFEKFLCKTSPRATDDKKLLQKGKSWTFWIQFVASQLPVHVQILLRQTCASFLGESCKWMGGWGGQAPRQRWCISCT